MMQETVEEKNSAQSVPFDLTSATAQTLDYSRYSLRPLLFEAAQAHRDGSITYQADGSVLFRNPYPTASIQAPEAGQVIIPPQQQFPAIFATFQDLNKALSQLSNSPR